MSDDTKEQAEPSKYDDRALFTRLVLSFQAAAWQQMGKVASVITGKIDRNLEMARHSIDMLAMLEEKTKGNLNEDESKYVSHVLYELRMNFLDEVKKGPDTKDEAKEEESADDNQPDHSGNKTE